MLSASLGHSSVVQILLQMGAKANEQNATTGNTAMHECANDVCAEMLISNGANVNALNWVDCSPLHLSSRRGDLKTVQMLLESKATINMRNKEGCTPLVEAIRCAPMMHSNSVATTAAYDDHVKIVHLLSPQDLFTRKPVDTLVEECRLRDLRIEELEERVRQVQKKAEQDMLDAANARLELKKSSAAVLHCFEQCIAHKSFKKELTIEVVEGYQMKMDAIKIALDQEEEKRKVTEEQKWGKKTMEEEQATIVKWPGVEELSVESMYVLEEIPAKKINQQPKKKSKKVIKKEKVELSFRGFEGAAGRLARLIEGER